MEATSESCFQCSMDIALALRVIMALDQENFDEINYGYNKQNLAMTLEGGTEESFRDENSMRFHYI